MKLVVSIALGLVLAPVAVRADDAQQCRTLDLSFVPSVASAANRFAPQIVAWLEDAQGNFVDTVYITHATGTFGIGNRPGRFDFNSAPLWPYGRRTTVFPIWAHKQPLRWPELVFQDGADSNLSHDDGQSSRELHFCRPAKPTEFDAVTCPSEVSKFDKGVFSSSNVSNYPPRNDLAATTADSSSVDMMATMNPFDAISQPTPGAGVDAAASYEISPDVPPGDYVLWVEVSKEFDMNATYNEQVYPSPEVRYAEYGLPYRGQPSVVYRVPFTLTTLQTTGFTADYAGYGDPEGLDGTIRPPDSTISAEPGSGAGRLALVSRGPDLYRVHVVSRREIDTIAPDVPRATNVVDAQSFKVVISFIAPGDDHRFGAVKGYEVRYRVGEPITEENFASSTLVTATFDMVPPGADQVITIEGMLPDTEYSIGIRAFDNCRNTSRLAVVPVTTAERLSGEVDACFIATAAYGSTMAKDVELLRSFRSSVLAKTVLGELAIETYYTFGPTVAGLVGESELLRATTRSALEPIVGWVRSRD